MQYKWEWGRNNLIQYSHAACSKWSTPTPRSLHSGHSGPQLLSEPTSSCPASPQGHSTGFPSDGALPRPLLRSNLPYCLLKCHPRLQTLTGVWALRCGSAPSAWDSLGITTKTLQRNTLDFAFFQMLEHLHSHNGKVRDENQIETWNSFMYHIRIPEVLCNIFSAHIFWLQPDTWSKVETLSTCGLMLAQRTFSISGHFKFLTSEGGMLNLK